MLLPAVPRAAAVAAPLRLVSLDYGLAETVLALGKPLLGVADAQDWTRWVGGPPLPPGVQNLGSDQEVNLELLASLRPDLILTTPYLDALTPTLERVAPCERLAIYEPGGGGPLERAESVTRRLAAILGDPASADRYLADTQAQFAADRDSLRRRPPRPVLLVNFMDSRHVRVYGAKSLWQDVLDRLGWPNAWTRPTTYWGFATVGLEELAAVPADTLLVSFEPVPADVMPVLHRSRLWAALPFAAPGRSTTLPPALVFGAVPSARRFARLFTDRLAGWPGP